MITAVLEILYYKSAGIAGGECRQSEFVALTLFGVGSATGASAYSKAHGLTHIGAEFYHIAEATFGLRCESHHKVIGAVLHHRRAVDSEGSRSTHHLYGAIIQTIGNGIADSLLHRLADLGAERLQSFGVYT